MASPLRLATRRSPLALAQAHQAQAALESLGYPCELVPMQSKADKHLDRPVQALGGKGVFVGVLEQALQDHRADIAVHSVKDMPAALEPHFVMPAMLPRADVRDVWIGNQPFAPQLGHQWGTGSLRRKYQLERAFPDITCRPIRGNILRRMQQLQEGLDGVILARAGLERLELLPPEHHCFTTDLVLPAAGQGAIGLECRADDTNTIDVLQRINHVPTTSCVDVERHINDLLGGHCFAPLATYVYQDQAQYVMHARVMDMSSHGMIEAQCIASYASRYEHAAELVDRLNAQGAQRMLTQSLP